MHACMHVHVHVRVHTHTNWKKTLELWEKESYLQIKGKGKVVPVL
jgi:hypothetical protein